MSGYNYNGQLFTVNAPLDLVKKELRNAAVQNLGTAPSSPSLGQLYVDTSTATDYALKAYLKIGNADQWVSFVTGSAGMSNPMTTLGDIIFGGSAGSASRLAGNITTTPQFLSSTGSAGIATSPAWLGSTGSNNVVLSTSPSIATPTFTGGATFSTGTSSVSLGATLNIASGATLNIASGATFTSSVTPVNATDVVNKQYVDNIAVGLTDWKQSVRATTSSNITLSGGAPNTISDGGTITLALNDRILVRGQSTQSENGIYYVTTLGSGSNGTWTRATDSAISADVTCGMYVYVEEGAATSKGQYVLNTPNPITLGSTSLTFVRFNGGTTLTQGTGITISGDTISLTNQITAAGPLGNATTVPIITYNAQGQLTAVTTATISGVSPVGASLTNGSIWLGNESNVAAAFTGNSTATKMFLNMTSSVAAWSALNFSDIVTALSYTPTKKYITTITGSGSGGAFTITHNLNTKDIVLKLYDDSDNEYIADVTTATVNSAIVTFGTNTPGAATHRVVVIG